MDKYYDRKIAINEWIITTRWFYMVAIFLIGILGNSLISVFNVKFSFFSIAFLLLVFLAVNAYFYRTLEKIKKVESDKKLKLLSVSQIAIELIILTIIMRLVGDESIAGVFFFLPIISAAIIFGVRGAVITAVCSAALVNLSMVYNYFDFIVYYILNKNFFSAIELMELRQATISLIEIITTSNFYLIVAVFSGYSFGLLFKREQKLIAKAEKLVAEKKMSEKEMERLDKTAQLLARQDAELLKVNNELSKKVKEMETSEKSLIRAFNDLQEARKKNEDEREKTAAIIFNFIDPIIVIDKNNRINLLNPAAKEIFGFINDDLGQKVDSDNNYSMENFKKIIKQDFKVKDNQALKSNDPNEEEIIINFGSQEFTYKVITAKVVDSKNEYIGTMKIFYNLTREKMIDKLKSEFISIAAHQLRTPLSAIKWAIKMILDGDVGKLNKEQEKLLFKGYQSNERIINLVNDMLNVSRIEEGRFGYSFGKENFINILDSEIDNLEGLIKRKNIKLVLIKPKRAPLVYMDKQKMRLALQNLLENAVKYTPDFGKIEISLKVGREFLKVRIKDNGIGVPKKDQEKLFSKFFRAENVVRMQTEGSGLGLFIVKNIIKKHGGEITFNSKEGIGTEFVFTLPLNK